MNYQSLFDDTDIRRGGDFCCSFFPVSDRITLRNTGRYLMLFVLSGQVELQFTYQQQQQLCSGQLIAVDQTCIIGCRCSDQTVLLEYTAPKRLARFLEQSSQAFDSSHSTIVPILPPLREWIDNLLEHELGADYTEEKGHEQRRTLARILMRYPRSILGDLFLPFFACAHGDCELCREPEEA